MARPATVIAQVTETPRTSAARKTVGTSSEETAKAPGAIEPALSDARTTRQAPVQIAAVISSKIQAPVLRPNTLSRARLLDRLNESVTARVTLVSADAGYGKTTLLTDFAARSGMRTLWYRLDSADTDVITWTNYLIAAGREVNADFGRATAALLTQVAAGGPPKSAYLASLLGEFGQLGDVPTVLILDDFHEVEHSAEVRELVGRLIAQAPPWLHMVIAARRRPPIEWARLAGMGELNEIGTDELRFSAAETKRLFAESYGLPLEAEVLRELDRRTRGWAASLQLFHGSIRGRSSTAVRALAKSLSGASGPIYDFLAEEVLGNVSDELERFLVRCSILERVAEDHVVALFAEGAKTPGFTDVRRWIEDGDRLGLLTRTSQVSEARQLHPLLRDFLGRQLGQRHGIDEIRAMHLRVARAVADADPLTACRHYIEAGHDQDAMACLGSSVVLTMGSGQWGIAAELIDRLKDVPANPAVAAIRARGLIEAGDLVAAEQLLIGLDISASSPDIRAVVRHTTLSLDWRLGDRDRLFATLREIDSDPETPRILGDIAQVFIDASSVAHPATALPELAERLVAMAQAQEDLGHSFYSAISLHNAAVALLNSGDFSRAIVVGELALERFDQLTFHASERQSTHSVIALCHLEIGNHRQATDHASAALGSGQEFADVPAELAIAMTLLGEWSRAEDLLHRAESLKSDGRSDVLGSALIEAAESLMSLPTDLAKATTVLSAPSLDAPLDLGYSLSRDALLIQALLLSQRTDEAINSATEALAEARRRKARRPEARLAVLLALAMRDASTLRAAVTAAARSGRLALLEVAEAVGHSLDVARLPEIEESIEATPNRWRPVLRRQLEMGDTPSGHAAAELLDRHGDLNDVVRLRAYAKTYRKKGSGRLLGRSLARRVSPPLLIHDLGRVTINIGDRYLMISAIRRKVAALLLYLITRPNFTATRDQVLDDLWPETDPNSATNSLNQSLYFLRREIDPWYEDDVSADYVAFQGDLVWLDRELVKTDSASFLNEAQMTVGVQVTDSSVIELIASYRGQFAPEFQYEEWAMSWRTRLHSSFLELVHGAVVSSIKVNDLIAAKTIAANALQVDPGASDIERLLVWIYWHVGQRSAARSQYRHLAALEAADGFEPTALPELVRESPAR